MELRNDEVGMRGLDTNATWGTVTLIEGCLGSGGMKGIDGRVYLQQTCCEYYLMNQLRICTH